MKETYPPRLLHLKAVEVRRKTGDDSLKTHWEHENRTLSVVLKQAMSRPWKLLGTQHIIQLFAVYQGFNYGMMYLFISSFPQLWEKGYGMEKGIASLNYISLAAGSLVGVNIQSPLMDAVHRRLKAKNGLGDEHPGWPEFRVPLMIPAAMVCPIGIFLFGWAAEAKLHWIVPNVSYPFFHLH